jgi:hypothetical protein
LIDTANPERAAIERLVDLERAAVDARRRLMRAVFEADKRALNRQVTALETEIASLKRRVCPPPRAARVPMPVLESVGHVG